MTHMTENDRAEFEAWAREQYPSINLERNGDEYRMALAKDYWSLWQAARRAQVVNGKGWGTSGTSMIDGHAVAAPVQLPDPEGVVTGKLGASAFVAGPSIRKGEKLYTERQVRQLLEEHGIK